MAPLPAPPAGLAPAAPAGVASDGFAPPALRSRPLRPLRWASSQLATRSARHRARANAVTAATRSGDCASTTPPGLLLPPPPSFAASSCAAALSAVAVRRVGSPGARSDRPTTPCGPRPAFAGTGAAAGAAGGGGDGSPTRHEALPERTGPWEAAMLLAIAAAAAVAAAADAICCVASAPAADEALVPGAGRALGWGSWGAGGVPKPCVTP